MKKPAAILSDVDIPVELVRMPWHDGKTARTQAVEFYATSKRGEIELGGLLSDHWSAVKIAKEAVRRFVTIGKPLAVTAAVSEDLQISRHRRAKAIAVLRKHPQLFRVVGEGKAAPVVTPTKKAVRMLQHGWPRSKNA